MWLLPPKLLLIEFFYRLERCPLISIPNSPITEIASGRIVDGSMPALSTSKFAPASWRSSPSAIWLRAELQVQRIRTLFLLVTLPA